MEKKQLTCISCPMGCSLEVAMEGKEVLEVTGYTCKRGLEYARNECTDPRRIVTTTVRLAGNHKRTVAIKTAEPIPKDKIFDCIQAVKNIELTAPVAVGDVILKNVCGTDIDMVATSAAGK